MEESFNSSEDSAKIGVKRKRERSHMQARTVAGRLPSRPACTTCTSAARLTVARRAVDQSGRPTGMRRFLLDSVDQPVSRKDGRPTGESVSPGRIQTSFLKRSRTKLWFPKTLGHSGYK